MANSCAKCGVESKTRTVDDLDVEWWFCVPCDDYAVNDENLEQARHLSEDSEMADSYTRTDDGLVIRV